MLRTSKIRIKLENVLDLDIIIDLSPPTEQITSSVQWVSANTTQHNSPHLSSVYLNWGYNCGPTCSPPHHTNIVKLSRDLKRT